MTRRASLLSGFVLLLCALSAALVFFPGRGGDATRRPVSHVERTPAADHASHTGPVNLRAPEIAAAQREEILASLPPFDPTEEVEVPLTDLSTPRRTLRLLAHPQGMRSALIIEQRRRIDLPRTGMPLQAVEIDGQRLAVFFRETFSGRLYVYVIGEAIEAELPLRAAGDAEPIFRAATFHARRLLAVLYDNERSVNEIVRIDLDRPSGSETEARGIALPSLEDPAGGTYEMIARLRFLARGERLWVVGGNLLAEVAADGLTLPRVVRLPDCLRVQDVAFRGEELRILCLVRAQGEGQPYSTGGYVVGCGSAAFKLLHWSEQRGLRGELLLALKGVPHLALDGELGYAASRDELAALLWRDLVDNHASGVMELGINNVEGRVAWSQIYFLNGLLDLLLLAASDHEAAALYGPIAAAMKRRLDIEMHLLDGLISSPIGVRTKGFTVKRVPAVFAVQTSRLLLLLERYRREIRNGTPLKSFEPLRAGVLSLQGHIETVAVAGPDSAEPRPGRRYLRWPKGSAFYFDGLNVPYNHQNEWAYAVLDTLGQAGSRTSAEARALEIAREIIDQFIEANAPSGTLPISGTWPYWWGDARAGWTADRRLSDNRSEYPGDKLVAWISFRSIDAMSVLAARDHLASAAEPKLRQGIATLTARGLLYPFVSASMMKREGIPVVEWTPALSYARLTAPSDFQNSVWAILSIALSAGGRSGRAQCR